MLCTIMNFCKVTMLDFEDDDHETTCMFFMSQESIIADGGLQFLTELVCEISKGIFIFLQI